MDGTSAFYDWIRTGIQRSYLLLNIGAGPGSDRKLKSLRGDVQFVEGIDPDPAVLSNPDLDHATVSTCKTLPYPDHSFDLAWADFVMEHVEEPLELLLEVQRVLKPGSSFFFRTPNKWHYVAMIARATPYWVHGLIANRVRGLPPEAHEPYRTFYRFNSRNDVLRIARYAGFAGVKLRFVEAEPSYLSFSAGTFALGIAYERFVNRYASCAPIRCNIFGQLISSE
jgi:SAM-dependent methyltransferase